MEKRKEAFLNFNMNKKGLAFFYTFMLGFSIIVLGIALATPVKQIIDNARNSTELNCVAPATDFDQALCWGLDILKFGYVGFVILTGFAIIAARKWVI